MKPTLFGYFGGNPSAVTTEITGSLTQFHRSDTNAIFGLQGEVDVVSVEGRVLVALAGTPQWRGKQCPRRESAEKLAAQYRIEGAKAIAHLSNSFVAVIYDFQQQSAIVAIDRIGRMPLAYAALPNGGICFSTDARIVANLVEPSPTLNAQALFDYSFFHAVPSAETIFKGVTKLIPATLCKWQANRVTTELYWQPDFARRTDASVDSLAKDFLTSLENGVKASEPDANTASFLSGGIDSSTVTGFLANILGRGRPAYTIGFEQTGYDETDYARVAAKFFGADLRVHYITTKEVENCVPELAEIYDEPFGNSSAVPALVCSRLAKADGITHMLAGDGGDELFAGNARYAKQRIFEAYNYVPGIGKAVAEKFFLSALIGKTPLRKVGSYISQARIPLPDRLESYNFLLRENIATMFEPDFLRQVNTQHPFELLRAQYSQPKDASTLDRMLYLDWKFTLADNDLRKVNATCRHAGVKVSFPWLDDSVIDFSTKLPSHLKLRGTKLRFFAKRALTGFLPQETITKSKHGFGLPFGQWLKTSADLQKQIYDLLDALARRGIFQPQFIKHLITEHRDGHAAYYGTMVWVLAMLEGWLQANKAARL